MLGLNDTSTLVGHFVSFPRESENRRDNREDEREGETIEKMKDREGEKEK